MRFLKTIFFTLLSFLYTNVLFAQDKPLNDDVLKRSEPLQQNGRHEIRINLLYSVIGIPELNYEYFFQDNMGAGLSVAFALEKPEDFELRSMLVPYYRVYFGNKKASGFFIEGNLAVVSQRDKYIDYNNQVYDKKYTNFGMGFAGGVKFLTRNGFVGEASLGLGRLFGESLMEVYPRGGISIGKRF